MGCSTNDQRTMEENTNPKNAKWNIIFVLGSPGGGKGTQRDKIKNKYKIYHYFIFNMSWNVCIERIQNRGDDRVDDNIDTIKKRFKSLKEETEPTVIKLKNYGPVYEIKADQTSDKVFEDIDNKLKNLLPTQ